MKIKNWIKRHAKEIVIGVIVSIVTTCIFTGAKWIIEIAPEASNLIWQSFLNAFCAAAAKTSDSSLISFVYSIVFGSFAAYVYNHMNQRLHKTKELIAKTEELLDAVSNPNLAEKDDEKEISTDALKNKLEQTIKDVKKGRRTSIVWIVLLALYFGHIFVFYFMPHSLWTEYQRDLMRIAPYMEEQDMDQLKSDWACMQTKADYDEIYERIDKIKEEHDLP